MPGCDERLGFKVTGVEPSPLALSILLRWEFWGSRVSGRRWRIIPDDDARREADGFVLSGSGHEVLQHRDICEQ